MSLSVCCFTQDPGDRVHAILSLFRPVADEIVVAADSHVGEDDLAAYARRRRPAPSLPARRHAAPSRLDSLPVQRRLDPPDRRRRGPERSPPRAAPSADEPARGPPVLAAHVLAVSGPGALARRASLVAGLPQPSPTQLFRAAIPGEAPRRRRCSPAGPVSRGAALPPRRDPEQLGAAKGQGQRVRVVPPGLGRGRGWIDRDVLPAGAAAEISASAAVPPEDLELIGRVLDRRAASTRRSARCLSFPIRRSSVSGPAPPGAGCLSSLDHAVGARLADAGRRVPPDLLRDPKRRNRALAVGARRAAADPGRVPVARLERPTSSSPKHRAPAFPHRSMQEKPASRR